MIMHFAHANGFPAGSYQQMFAALAEDIKVIALEKFAHSPRYPVSNNWELQADELIEFIEQNSEEPVYAVGHSFGAVVSYIAACKNPSLFKGVIMLDPPLITGMTGQVVDMIRGSKLFDHITPAKLAETRCTQWPLDTNLTEYFKAKGLFKNMQEACIEDYVSSAIEEKEGGFILHFDHRVEADVFRTIPTHIHKKHGALPVKGMLVTGEHTKVCTAKRIKPFMADNALSQRVIKGGGHMFPLEKPVEVAQLITQQLNQWHSMD